MDLNLNKIHIKFFLYPQYFFLKNNTAAYNCHSSHEYSYLVFKSRIYQIMKISASNIDKKLIKKQSVLMYNFTIVPYILQNYTSL